ncbi:MAG TPA: AMP-binding protein [Gaiellaceae bacterium]|nr:AMP-binding protein [Gaiellaceae bacterium]
MTDRALRPVFEALEERTLPRLLRHQAEARPDEPFLRFLGDDGWVGFAAMEQETNRIANAFRLLGVEAGDRVALILPNSLGFVRLWFGAAKLGAIEVPVDPELRGRPLAHVLTNSAPRVVCCHVSVLPALAEVSVDLVLDAVVVVDGAAEDAHAAGVRAGRIHAEPELREGGDATPDAAVGHADPLAILYTSGSTGPPKGVLMPHNQFYVFTEMFARNLDLHAGDSYYTPLPLFHADAQLFGVYFPLIYGTRGTIDARFSASRYWENVRASEATATNMLGVMAHILWKREPSPDDAANPIRVCQALPMVPFRREFEERFGIALATAYGQTETCFVTYDTPDEWREGSCGRPAPGFQVAVVDASDRPLPPGEVGEIVVRHDDPWTVCSGYYGLPELTLATSRNLWWHSGDRGHFDADGWLYFDGRVKDAIRRRGVNISAEEVEGIVGDHPAVLESAAVGIPSELSEDDIKVVAVARDGAALTTAELLEHCVRHMPRHMVPRYLEIRRAPLPRTPTEKIAKETLRAEGVTADTFDRETTTPKERA